MKNIVRYGFECIYKENFMEQIQTWIRGIKQCFEPTEMSGLLFGNEFCNYNEQDMYDRIQVNIAKRGMVDFSISQEENDFTVFAEDCSPGKVVNFYLYIDKEKMSFDFDALVDELMLDGGMLAYKCSREDIFWQDMEDISIYEFYGKSTKGLRTIKSPLGLNEMVIDIEQNPGHSHNVFRVWFGAWHKMWFGEDYYQFVPREKLEKYKNCYENKYLGNNVIRITLFEDIWDFENKKNRKRQLKFRKFMEIDKAAESYRKNHKADPPVETIFEKGEHGGEKAILYYVDEEGKSSLKSKAKYIKYCEVSANGKILYEELRENI